MFYDFQMELIINLCFLLFICNDFQKFIRESASVILLSLQVDSEKRLLKHYSDSEVMSDSD